MIVPIKYRTFGERVAFAVETAQDKGLTMEQMGKLCGRSKGAISQWGDGSKSAKFFPAEALAGLSLASGLDATWIFFGDGPPPVQAHSEIHELVTLLHEDPDSAREWVEIIKKTRPAKHPRPGAQEAPKKRRGKR